VSVGSSKKSSWANRSRSREASWIIRMSSSLFCLGLFRSHPGQGVRGCCAAGSLRAAATSSINVGSTAMGLSFNIVMVAIDRIVCFSGLLLCTLFGDQKPIASMRYRRSLVIGISFPNGTYFDHFVFAAS
jgi:hypothetical protein